MNRNAWPIRESRVRHLTRRAARRQPLAGPIGRAAQRAVKQPREQLVERREQVGVAAEIVGQMFDPALSAAALEQVAQLDEQAWLGLAKTVDALLHVADHEAVGAARAGARDQTQNLDLYRTGVLVLVHQDVLVTLLQQAGDVGRGALPASVRITEQVQGQTQHVAELLRRALALRRGQHLVIAVFQAQQRGSQFSGRRRVLQDRLHHLRLPHTL